jgi:hypothetical protein
MYANAQNLPAILELMLRSPATRFVSKLNQWRSGALAVTLYTVAALALYGWHNPFSNSHIVDHVTTDQVQETWFLAWFAHALAHLQNPFVSHAMNAPHGINLMANTSMPLLGLVFAPITWLLGPLATYNVLLRLALVLSAWAAWYVGRRIGLSRVASFVVGLVYGFSSQQTVQAQGHLFLTFAPLLPLALYTGYRLVSADVSIRRYGLALGLLLGTDYLISAERALVTIMVLVLGGIVAGLLNRSRVRPTLRRLTRAVVPIGIGLAAITVIPLYFQLLGAYAVKGKAHSWILTYRADLFSFVFPQHYAVAPLLGHKVFIEGLAISPWENGTYVGVLLLATCAFGLWFRRTSKTAWWIALTTLGFAVMTLGTDVLIHGKTTWIHSPYKLLSVLPFVKNVEPVRYMMVVWLGLALLAGFAVEHWWQKRTSSSWARFALAGVALAVGLIAPRHSIPSVPTGISPWFSTPQAQRLISTNDTVLFYPYPSWLVNQPMLVQALDSMRYRIIGGQAIVNSGPDGVNWGVRPLTPSAVPDIFFRAYSNDVAGDSQILYSANHYSIGPQPPIATATSDFRTFASRFHVNTIVVEKISNWGLADTYLRAAFGTPLFANGAIEIWHTA